MRASDEDIEAYVQRVVATWPPLGEEQKQRLSRLLTPPPGGWVLCAACHHNSIDHRPRCRSGYICDCGEFVRE